MTVLSARETDQLLSPAAYEVRVLFDIKMKARDGVLLSNDIYLPRAPGPFPTIVTRTPYENSGENFMNWGIWWAQHGYAAVLGDTRGRYDSDGDFYPWISDPNDGDDTFEWIANQAWCDGKIGTWGRSYGGVNQWYQMPRSNPRISSTSPQVTPADNWESAHYVNGASQWGLNTLIVPVWNVSLRAAGRPDLYNWDRIFRTLPLRDADLEMIGRRCDYFQDWYEHPTYDDYWKQFQWDNQYERVHVPTRNQCGWYDAYPLATFKSWRGAVDNAPDPLVKRQQRVLMGPWSHTDPTDGIRRARYRGGRVPPELIQPGEVHRYDLDLAPTANVFKADHRIRLDITSSNFPRFDRNLNTGDDIGTGTRILTAQQMVFHTAEYPSHVLLPIIPR